MRTATPIFLSLFLAVGLAGCASDSSGLVEPGQVAAKARDENKVKQRREAPAAAPSPREPRIADLQTAPPSRAQPAAFAAGAPPAPLTAEEVRALLMGNSLFADGSALKFAALHRADGTLKGKAWGSDDPRTGTGTWKVEPDGAYCRKWDNEWAGGEWGCFRVFRQGNALIMEHISGAGANGQMTLVQGNAHEL